MAECSYTGNNGDPQMAASEETSVIKDSKQFICGICLEYYSTPRYLPTCGHTFCEHCLWTYASNLQVQQLEQDSKQRLECPVCRKPHNLPETHEVTLAWIQTFPLNTVIIKMMESLPASSQETPMVTRNCDACKEGGEIIVAVKFCLDCKETMCETCTTYHKRFKLSSGHKLIDFKDMSTEARSCVGYFDTFTKCSSHPERDVEFYCKFHDVIVCAVCASTGDHKLCDTGEVSDHDPDIAGLKQYSERLASQMKRVIEHLNLLQTLKKENKTKLKTKLTELRARVNQVRDHIVKLMDTVVSHVADVTKQIEIEHEDKTDEDMSRVTKLKELTEEKFVLLDTIEQHGTERHKLISAHLMKSQIDEIDKHISEEDRRVRNVDAEVKFADVIKKLIESTDVEKLVQVAVNESESSHKHHAAMSNYLRDCKLVRVEEHTVKLNPVHNPHYYGAAIHTGGKVILSDYCADTSKNCGYLSLYNPGNKTMLKLKLNRPYSAAQIDDTHIAVSIPDDNAISIMTVDNELRVEKTLKTQNTPRSMVALNNGHLAVSWSSPPAYSVIDITGADIVQQSYLDQDSSGRKFRSFEFLVVDEKRHHVIQPCNNDKIVYCFDFTGKPVFQYTGPDPGLRDLRDVALDKCGNIYLCHWLFSSASGSIHKMSPAGEPISIITEGVPSYPRAICSDMDGAGFWVTSGTTDKIVHLRLEHNPDV